MQEANEQVVKAHGEKVAQQSAAQSAAERRERVVAAATAKLEQIYRQLLDALLENAPTSTWHRGRSNAIRGGELRLGDARLEFHPLAECRELAWGAWTLPFRVLAYSALEIHVPMDPYHFDGRSHSLWFCDAKRPDEFHWFETAFMVNPFMSMTSRKKPFALSPSEDSAKALACISEIQVAWPFTPIEIGADDDFLDRWMEWFALASTGQLHGSNNMPERDPRDSWRRK